MNKTFDFYADPGHAWLKVKRADLVVLGILSKITPFSYQRGNCVYLEEDCDAYTFVKRFAEVFGHEPKFRDKHTNRQSRIRSYEHFGG